MQQAINALMSVAYPVTYVAVAIGVTLLLINQRDKGLQIIKQAIVFYIIVQFLPAIFHILYDVLTAVVSVFKSP